MNEWEKNVIFVVNPLEMRVKSTIKVQAKWRIKIKKIPGNIKRARATKINNKIQWRYQILNPISLNQERKENNYIFVINVCIIV